MKITKKMMVQRDMAEKILGYPLEFRVVETSGDSFIGLAKENEIVSSVVDLSKNPSISEIISIFKEGREVMVDTKRLSKEHIEVHLYNKKDMDFFNNTRDVIYREYMEDLVAIPYVAVEGHMFPLTEYLLDKMKMTENEVFSAGISNRYPYIANFEECIENDDIVPEFKPFKKNKNYSEAVLIRTKNENYGAAAILYPGFLKNLCKAMNTKKIAILPSSIHEVMVVADTGYPREVFDNIVREAETEAKEHDILSRHAYFYEVC